MYLVGWIRIIGSIGGGIIGAFTGEKTYDAVTDKKD